MSVFYLTVIVAFFFFLQDLMLGCFLNVLIFAVEKTSPFAGKVNHTETNYQRASLPMSSFFKFWGHSDAC